MIQAGLMRWHLVALLSILALSESIGGESAKAPVSQRYLKANVDEAPDFQRHVIPLLGRLGCNGRACHGSFQGQGGFRLSLFGYDFKADHEALTGGEDPRVNQKNPSKSLMLLKPTRTVAHRGRQRIKPGSWEYQLLLRWIKNGAKGLMESKSAELISLSVEPKEIIFQKERQSFQLKVLAQWSDQTTEDVTPLCRFRSNDESIASINSSGLVTARGEGSTHVVVFYDNGIVDIPVLMPVSDQSGDRYPKVPAPTKIDQLVIAKLRKLGIVPSDICNDADFLRRVSLDITGTLPSSTEVQAFLADKMANKRARKIDELLKRPSYAAWWTTRLCDWTGNAEQNLPVGGEQGLRSEKATQWYQWIHRRVAENMSYDKLVQGLVVATSRQSAQSDEEFFTEMSSYFRTNNPTDFSKRKTMPYFWSRGRFTPPQTLRFSYAFLGVRLECAQCHKHPYDQWTKEDYEQFQVFFSGVRFTTRARQRAKELKQALGLTADQDSGGYKKLFAKLVKEGKVVPWGEVVAPDWRRKGGRKALRLKGRSRRVITPTLLGGEKVLAEQFGDPREPVMAWLRQKDNPYFARAFVNRVWANYFHVGIVDPPDDMNLANPPSNRALLDYLASGFVNSGYDMKWVHREITNSRTYQLSWRSNETNKHDNKNFSRAVLRRLPAEVISDALNLATASDAARKKLESDPVGTRQIGVASCLRRRKDKTRYALSLFGKPAREVNCDCERSNEPSLLQTVYLRNDAEVRQLLTRRDGWLQQVTGKSKVEMTSSIRQAYLRTLSRFPNDRELKIASQYMSKASNLRAGLEDLLWTLINTKEFIVNR